MRRTGSASTRDEPQIVRRAGPSAVHHYRAGLRSAARGASLPYGYTVTMWCSGQVLIHFHGTPGLGLVALFAGGALTGFGLLQSLGRGDAGADLQLGAAPTWTRGGGIQLLAVAATLVIVAAVGWLLPPALSWALGGMATVVGYLGVIGLEYALQARTADSHAFSAQSEADPDPPLRR
jgi:hypothetical protein